MPPKRRPSKGQGLPSSRSALTKVIPSGRACKSRSTAMTFKFLEAKSRECRPAPLATSSTGPRATSGAQRLTQSDGSSESCAMLGQQLAQDRAVAARLVIAVAADGKVRIERQRREKCEQALGRRGLHLAAIGAGEARPVLLRARHQPGARREIGQPDVVVVAARVIGLAHAARRPAHGAQARALLRCACATEADYADSHAPPRARSGGWCPRTPW